MEEYEEMVNDATAATVVAYEHEIYLSFYRLKVRQETREATRASKNAEVTIKQIATQELQAKGKMQEWKKYVMQKVTQEPQAIKLSQDDAMETQRQSFQIELERVRGKLQQVELRSKKLEDGIKTLKSKEKAPQHKPTLKYTSSRKGLNNII